jgi:hypothetical protein
VISHLLSLVYYLKRHFLAFLAPSHKECGTADDNKGHFFLLLNFAWAPKDQQDSLQDEGLEESRFPGVDGTCAPFGLWD